VIIAVVGLVALGIVGVIFLGHAAFDSPPTQDSKSQKHEEKPAAEPAAIPEKSPFSNAVYEIRISGTPGLSFSGSYGAMQAGGSMQMQSVDGKVPQTYKITGSIGSATFQKQSAQGRLVVEIWRDGKLIKQGYTDAAYGVVALATSD
jgi:hypothetical protein